MRFTTESLWNISLWLREQKTSIVSFEVVNPDFAVGAFNGEFLKIEGICYRYRSHKAWIDLAEVLGYRYLTPQLKDEPFVEIRYQMLDTENSWHLKKKSPEEKYGIDSSFFRIQKLEEPTFLLEYTSCLQKLKIQKNMRILSLGVNRGDEFAIFKEIVPREIYETLQFVGIDIAESAIEHARKIFPQNHEFIVADICGWQSWELGKFDVFIAVGVLQSPALDSKNMLSPLLKKFLHPQSKVVLGFPNSRYIDGEVQFGGKSKNYQKPELSLLLKDIGYYRRLLFRKGYNVTVTGKYYLFVTGVK